MKKLSKLFLLTISLLFVPEAHAGYILTTDANNVSYTGTTDPWVEDESVTGRQIGDSTTPITVSLTGDTNVVSNNSPLVIDNAAVSVVFVRVGQSSEGSLTIRNGAVLTSTGRFIGNDHGAATIVIDNGTLIGKNSLDSEGAFELGYHGNATVDIINGGRIVAGNVTETAATYYDVNLGGRASAGTTSATPTVLTLGKEDGSDEIGGSIICKNLNLANKSNTNINLYRGSIIATEGLTTGAKNSVLTIGENGIVTVGKSTASTTAGLTIVGEKKATVSSLTASNVIVGTYENWGHLIVGGTGTADSVTIGNGTAGQTFDAVRGAADFSAAETVAINVDTVNILTGNPASSKSRASTVTLGKSNTITADSLTMVDSTATNYIGATATLTLGAANTLNINTLIMGGTKAQGTDNKCVTVGIADAGTLALNGKTGQDSKANLYIAYNNQEGTGNSSFSTVDFSNGGAINMNLSNLYVGRNMSSNTGATASGELKLGASGTVTAEQLWVGTVNAANGGTASGLLTTAGTNVTATTLKLGSQSTSTSAISASAGTIYTPNSVLAVGESSVTLSGSAKLMVGNNWANIGKGLFVAGGKEMTLGSLETTKLTVGLHDRNSSNTIVTENGELTVGTAGDSDFVRIGAGLADDSVVVPKGQVNFSAVETVTINVNDIRMLTNPLAENINANTQLILGTNNTISANSWTILSSLGANLIGSTAAIEFGEGVNDLNVDSWIVGGTKAQGKTVDGKITGATVTIRENGTFDLAGKADGTKANLYIAYNYFDPSGTTSNSSVGSMDLSNATSVNMSLGELVIGYANSMNSTTNNVTNGELLLGDNATVTADSITMATQSGKPAVKGTLSFGGNSTVTVSGAIQLGNTVKSEAVLNMSGGMLKAASITKTGDNSAFNWTGGTLSVDTIDFDLTQNGATTVLNPGGTGEIGSTTINGDYSIESGELRLEIGATGADKLMVSGDSMSFGENAKLVIDVLSLDGLTEYINLITAPMEFGIPDSQIQFDGLTLPNEVVFSWIDLGNGTIAYQANTGVPEPATWTLLILGTLGWGFFRKRKNA